MPAISQCPNCHRQVQIPETLFGRAVRCPLCGQSFSAGGASAPLELAAAPWERREDLLPHRGGLILTLGILSLLICGLLGPFAWIMGSNDLAKMHRGRMDKSGYGATQAGYILGIISTDSHGTNLRSRVLGCLDCRSNPPLIAYHCSPDNAVLRSHGDFE
ncbi:MAG: hypothetical protein NZM42_01910 [Gemmatales bacterium]|nr:hypothetical protein [Gemmatales bacterium]MDW8221607.1 hypothetical protein [Gemmatales bacterium]